MGFSASQRPHHSRLTYHVLHSRTDFACFSLKKSRTSDKTLTLTLLNQQHCLPMMVLNCLLKPVTEEKIRKLVLRKSKYDQVTPLLQELHWLPIKCRPQCKIATSLYRVLDSILPGYLSQTLNAYEPTRTLRSSCENSSKSQSAILKRSGSVPLAFLDLLSGTLCHPISEILLPFRLSLIHI